MVTPCDEQHSLSLRGGWSCPFLSPVLAALQAHIHSPPSCVFQDSICPPQPSPPLQAACESQPALLTHQLQRYRVPLFHA